MNRFHDLFLPVNILLVVAFAAAVAFWRSDAIGDDSSGSAVADSGRPTGGDPERQIEEPPYSPKSKAQLRRELTPIQFKVTQNADTEPAFRNKYWDNKKEGLYRCVVCGQSLFSSETKFKSGTGWPSFWQPIRKDHVGYQKDYFLFYPRTEVHCSRCDAHLGHVFDDGPKDKTGKRYCMNSAALRFEAAKQGKQGTDDRPTRESITIQTDQ